MRSNAGFDCPEFAALIDSIRELWGPRCVLLNVPIGQGGEFKGVAGTLRVPDDTDRALLDPTEIHEPLIESIIEVDEAVMEMDLTDRPFLVFTDVDEKVKVVYRREDGNYGLIESQTE